MLRSARNGGLGAVRMGPERQRMAQQVRHGSCGAALKGKTGFESAWLAVFGNVWRCYVRCDMAGSVQHGRIGLAWIGIARLCKAGRARQAWRKDNLM